MGETTNDYKFHGWRAEGWTGFMVLESRCWRGSRAESVHATLAPEAVSIPWPGAAWLHSLPSSDPLLLHLFVLPSVWTKFLFTFLKTTHSGTFRPSMKIIPTKTHLKIVSKAMFMDLKKWLSLREGRVTFQFTNVGLHFPWMWGHTTWSNLVA